MQSDSYRFAWEAALSVTVEPNWDEIQRGWDEQQQAYMPDREERFAAMLDAVEALCGPKPRVLDLACGTGSITRRLLQRLPDATSVALDLDPALLRIAAGTFDGDPRVQVVAADLGLPGWRDVVEEAGGEIDAVLTATALHWLPEDRLRSLYAEFGRLLRPGGVFVNADSMADEGLAGASARIDEWLRVRREALYADAGVLSWEAWWDQLRRDPAFADTVVERDAIFAGGSHTESMPSSQEHQSFLREAGFSEVGLIWRGLTDAAVLGVR